MHILSTARFCISQSGGFEPHPPPHPRSEAHIEKDNQKGGEAGCLDGQKK